jgi:hypothetical protein
VQIPYSQLTSPIRRCPIFDREAYYAMSRFFHRLGVGFLAGIILCAAFIILWYALLIIIRIPVVEKSLDDSFVGPVMGFYLWNLYLFFALSIPLGQIYSFCFFRRQWKQAMKKPLNSSPFAVICKVTTVLVLIGVVFKVAFYVISVGSPSYDYDIKLPSPDARYDLVVLRGDASAIDDFSYNIYVFPHALTPKETPQGKQVWMTGIWRDKQYLVYSGYSVPMFRWTGTNAIEIDLDDAYENVFYFDPVKRPYSDTVILTSLVIGKEDKHNTMP